MARSDIEKCEFFHSFFKIVLAIQGPLRIRMNFKIKFSISAKKWHWNFDRIDVGYFAKYRHLNNYAIFQSMKSGSLLFIFMEESANDC